MKSYEEQRDHFIERLKERYDLTINHDEYETISQPHKVFHGFFGKKRRKTVGYVFINDVKVWVLRDGIANCLATCYPPEVEHSELQMIRACFSGLSRDTAMQIWRLYGLEKIKVSKMAFGSIKDAAIYFFSKTKFAPLHIDRFKYGSVSTVKVCAAIGKILEGKSEYVSISLKNKPRNKKKPNT